MTVVAVDGPAASGKGTVSRMLAQELGYAYLDTGKLYRAVGLAVVRSGGEPSDPSDAEPVAKALDPATLDDPELKSDTAAAAASKVAAIDGVRAALLQFQRDFAASPPNGEAGAVLDGRDIGTVVCPDAPVKLFVTASVEIRAERRHKELLARGDDSIYARVLQDLQERDARDSARSVAPMKPAEDAIELDTSALSIEQALEAALILTKDTLAKR